MHAPIPGLDRDAVILLGIEPNMRWRRFTDLVAGLADEVGVELVVTLGSLLADVPHTRPAPVTGSATDQQLIEELGLERSRYEGPTGIVGVLHDAFYRRGISRRESLGRRAALRVARAEPARGARLVRTPRFAARRVVRHERAAGAFRDVRDSGESGRRVGRRDGRVRRGARAAQRRSRAAGHLRRDARRGAHALPARPRARQRRRAQAAGRTSRASSSAARVADVEHLERRRGPP